MSPFSMGVFVSYLHFTAKLVGLGADKRHLMGNSFFKQQV